MTTNSLVIRAARVNDARAVHALFLTAQAEIPLAANFDDALHLAWVRDQCRLHYVWAAETFNQIAGIMVLVANEISYLVTARDHRRIGVGQALLDHARTRIWRKYQTGPVAKVRPDNRPVVQLLLNNGFEPDRDMAAQPGWVFYRGI